MEVIDRLEQERQACLSSKPDVKQAELDVDSVMNESVITSERDTYMACKLQGIARASPSNLVLVIVGMGHLDGIETKLLRKISSNEFDNLSMKPVLSDADKILKRPLLQSRGIDLKIMRTLLQWKHMGA